MRTGLTLLCLSLVMKASLVVALEPTVPSLRLNQIQVLGTHNSYHLCPPAGVLKAAIAYRKDAKDWDYCAEPLDQQLDHGVRSFELDLHLSDKGWQVMHVPAFDSGTTVPMFTDGAARSPQVVRIPSRHVPISFLLELKEEGFQLSRSFRRPEATDLAPRRSNPRSLLARPAIDSRRCARPTQNAMGCGPFRRLADCERSSRQGVSDPS